MLFPPREFRRYRDLDQYLEQCKRQAPIFGAIRNVGNRFELKFKVIGGAMESTDTRFLQPDHFKVKFDVAADGISRYDRKFDSAVYRGKNFGASEGSNWPMSRAPAKSL